ncbi:hypothetical protein [Streptantibioticus cattleyicolor]|uniref:Uncharacterized protein n=1 Tax=Streptantibioticus cattleyicolor (strain ATCC 35852 / DSM 46488 / JCM 4925 / NBRC 14057 / NRRL 8057) TaxID=1003195 RepID=F8JMH0_STREN|nr:hypothetical protein [Streptantibioticus cattleyicolor]AEW99351.1 hypothetical protein SCATT_p11580 [Streptantibioticus cattleyicolor NRRL 8057 = DSM 46488]CCB71608.1 protein of unknown function [Streptantibioticus cattleyicolor NRRL 8057 = DSM 46488]
MRAAAQLTRAPCDIPGNVRRLVALAADPGPRTGPYDPRLDPVRASGIAVVLNCAVPMVSSRPDIGTPVFGADGDQDDHFQFGGVRVSLATC